MSDYSALDPCVHCGFCLPACPTYTATGDEADSPRGRIVLMRALERGELPADDPALTQHLDACLGCRACEPACPSGVGYGRGLEAARAQLAEANGIPWMARLLLAVFASPLLGRMTWALGRVLRSTGLPARWADGSRFGFSMGMLAATSRTRTAGAVGIAPASEPVESAGPTVAIFRGCVMDGLFAHVHDATVRTLRANGYRVVEVEHQVCCGALHEHAGDTRGAKALAAVNVSAFVAAADHIVVNSAGCGALLKDYGHLLGTDAAARMSAKVRDVSELLSARGPRPGGALEIEVAYDAPCHLQHAQRVQEPALAVLRAIPGLRLRLLPGSDRCCGSAGIYSMLHPDLARTILDEKLDGFTAAHTTIVATGNPGCLMQIGAGVRSRGLPIDVLHPVELLDRSYAQGGVYR